MNETERSRIHRDFARLLVFETELLASQRSGTA